MADKKILRGKTESGFDYAIDEKDLDNMELVDALAETDDGDSLALSRVSLLLLGKEQRKRLYDFIRDESGRVPAAEFGKSLKEIFESIKHLKNS